MSDSWNRALTRAAYFALLLGVGPGCTVILAPDRAAITLDGAVEGGMDADMDADVDADLDAGPDASDARCNNVPAFEVSCTNGDDDDCDGFRDCEDFDCAGAVNCCDESETTVVRYDAIDGAWQALGTPARSDEGIDFGTGRSAVLLADCSPIAFGAAYRATLQAGSGLNGDYAALVMGPVNEFGADGLLTELAVILQNQEFRVERAGTPVGNTLEAGTSEYSIELNVFPGADEAGRAVLRAQVSVAPVGGTATVLLDDVAIMPLADLIECGSADGLFVGFEGSGGSVRVTGAEFSTEVFACGNPSQLREDRDYTIDSDLFDGLGPGGLGEPALAAFAVSTDTNERLELWLDAADRERADEIFVSPTYTVHGAIYSDGSWARRTAMAAGREPSIAAVTDSARIQDAGTPFVAYVDESLENPRIAVSRVDFAETGGFLDMPPQFLPQDTCDRGMRDPSLVHLSGTSDEFLVVFTCLRVGLADSIGGMRLTYDLVGRQFAVVQDSPNLLSGTTASSAKGVFSPELLVHARADDEFALPMWYLARDSSEGVALHFASGVLAAGENLPRFEIYAGNPILEADDPILGSAECIDCSLQSMAVADSYPGLFWDPPTYFLLINRTRYDTLGDPIHELLPVTQPRPTEP
ncbi:MAG: hypothetical protein AB8I08_15110 [Sandaracinaceae bacterium]